MQSLTLAAAAAAAAGRQPGQPQPFYPDWPTAAVTGFQATVPAPYQPVTSGSDPAYMDQALAAAALLNNYVQLPPPPISQTQPPVQSTPPPAAQVVENVESGEVANPESRECERESDDSTFASATTTRAKFEGKPRVNDRKSVDKIKEKAVSDEILKKQKEDDNCTTAGSEEEKQQQAVSSS